MQLQDGSPRPIGLCVVRAKLVKNIFAQLPGLADMDMGHLVVRGAG